MTDTETLDSVQLLVIKIDDTLADIGNLTIVEASKMIDALLDMRLMALSMREPYPE